MRSTVTIVDEFKSRLRLGKIVDFIPTRFVDQDVALQIPMNFAKKQVCPDHPAARANSGLGWTYVRAKWNNTNYIERPALMFMCPRGHIWSVVFNQSLPKEGSF